jgi:hypothetical protein
MVVNDNGRHKNFVHYIRSWPDWDVCGSHSEATDVVSYITGALHDAVPIDVGVLAAGYTVQGLGFDLGRGAPGISVTVLAQVILYMVLVTGGRRQSGIWHCRYLLHIQHRGLRERNQSNETCTISVIKHTFFLRGEGPRSRFYGRTTALRLLVQPL